MERQMCGHVPSLLFIQSGERSICSSGFSPTSLYNSDTTLFSNEKPRPACFLRREKTPDNYDRGPQPWGLRRGHYGSCVSSPEHKTRILEKIFNMAPDLRDVPNAAAISLIYVYKQSILITNEEPMCKVYQTDVIDSDQKMKLIYLRGSDAIRFCEPLI